MLSQNQIKRIQSLQKKKFRQKYNLFVVEGNKSVQEIVKSNYIVEAIYSTAPIDYANYTLISSSEFKKISSLKTPQGILALVEIPDFDPPLLHVNTIVLDGIQDPGNLGTIIRTADWFGISQIIASNETVSLYNPKVIQATMGSFTRVNVVYQELELFLNDFEGVKYSADMNGESIYSIEAKTPFALIMGNEGNGVNSKLLTDSEVISIPNESKNQEAESLNVSVATAIILSNLLH